MEGRLGVPRVAAFAAILIAATLGLCAFTSCVDRPSGVAADGAVPGGAGDQGSKSLPGAGVQAEAGLQPVGAAAGLSPARLVQGPLPVKGLPFFGQNAIAALSGVYAVGAESVQVWSCRSQLWFSPSWKRTTADLDTSSTVLALLEGVQTVLAIQGKGYTLLVALPGDKPALRRFAAALDRRFAFFFENAASDAELSFPAFLDFKP